MKTGRAGCPDITVCYQGRFIGLEIKRPAGTDLRGKKVQAGKQLPTQKKAQEMIEKAGGEYYLIYSLSELIKILK